MSDIHRSIFTMAFPLSYFLLLIGLAIGIGISFVFFGIITCIALLLLLYTDIINIRPIIEGIHRVFTAIFPLTYSNTLDNIRESFRVEHVAETMPEKGIYIFHPHGMFSTALVFHIGTPMTDWAITNITGVALSAMFMLPFTKQILHPAFIPSTYSTMKEELATKSLALCLGGFNETAYVRPGVITAYVTHRRGIFRMALETGTPLVPVLTYGENELYDMYHSPFLDALQKNTMICFPTISSIMQWISIIYKPLKNPLRTVVGAAIPVSAVEGGAPTDEQIVALRTTYIAALRSLYAETRPSDYQKELEVV
jgi:2-acylglycerol O-acyltransferase 2